MKSDSKGKGQLLWSVAPQPQFARVRSVFFDVNHDGQWHDYTLKLPVAQAIKHLRLDPCARARRDTRRVVAVERQRRRRCYRVEV